MLSSWQVVVGSDRLSSVKDYMWPKGNGQKTCNRRHPDRFACTDVTEMITELICFEPEICICNAINENSRENLCNERFSADIPTDLSL